MSATSMSPSVRHICRRCAIFARQSSTKRKISALHTERRTEFSAYIHSASRSNTTRFASSQSGSPVKLPTKRKINGSNGFYENQYTIFSASNEALVRKAQEFGDRITKSTGVPSEEETLNALQVIDSAVKQLVYDARTAQEERDNALGKAGKSPAKALLFLNQKQQQQQQQQPPPGQQVSDTNPKSVSLSVELLSKLAYKIVTHPATFLSPKVLAVYISLQSALNRPDTFPEIFDLYANKPAPDPQTVNPIKYREVNPRAAAQAIDKRVADEAVDAAIKAKNLTLALDIIQTTYSTPAFRRNKFIRLAIPPLSLLGLAPVAAYIAGAKLSEEVLNVDPTQFTTLAVAGTMTYIGVISTLGYITISTANDQMERVTWIPGTPLRERWLREDERAAIDKVAMAWGFKSLDKRGEEEGEEWETLREWCGLHNMELDRTDLMEGME